MNNAVITGMGYCVPPKILTNYDLEKMVETSNEWIVERTGIEKRHILDDDKFGTDIAIQAALNALENAKMNPEDIDMILCATVTPDMATPSNACIIQGKIGAINAAAMDLNAACTGFVYALSVANSYIKSNEYKNILIVSVESLSKVTDWKDRTTCVLFGDGAGAAIVSASDEDYGIVATDLGANGKDGMLLTILNTKITEEQLERRVSKIPQTLWMDGGEVFKFAVRAMVSSTKELLNKVGKTYDDVDVLVPHQANLRIIDGAAKRMKIDNSKVLRYISEYGNMSSASIPIAICRALEDGKIKDGDNLILVGFGGGLTWASAFIKWKL